MQPSPNMITLKSPEPVLTTAELLEKARLSAGVKRHEETLAHCQALLAKEPLQPEALTLFTLAATHLGCGDEVQALAQRLVSLDPNHPELHHIAGTLLASSNQISIAVDYFRNAVNLDASNPARHANAARIMLKSGLRDEASGYARYAACLGETSADLTALLSDTRRATSRPTRNDSKPLRVVVVSSKTDPRVRKLGRAIRGAGSEPIFLCGTAPTSDAYEEFEHVLSFDSPWEALRIAKSFEPDLIHVCAHMNYDVALAFTCHRPAPVVIDTYDVLTGMWTEEFFEKFSQFENARNIERYCLEQADGICNRSLQVQVLKRQFDYHTPQNCIFWPEYNWNDRLPSRKLSADDGKLHVVYSGVIHPEDNPQDWLAEILETFGVHFHVYPLGGPPDTEGFRERFSTYVALDRDLEHFHLHEPVPHEEWLTELSRYDVLIHVLKFLFFGTTGEHYTYDKLKLAWANKWADAQDCDVYYLAHDFMLLAHLAERTEMGQGVTWEDVNSPDFWDDLRCRAVNGEFDFSNKRERYSVNGNAERLMRFYQDVIQNR